MRETVRAVVEAALYFVVPKSEVEAIPESRSPGPRPPGPRPRAWRAPPRGPAGRAAGDGKHERAEYWREYARHRYQTDPDFRRRRLEAVKRSRLKRRGAT